MRKFEITPLLLLISIYFGTTWCPHLFCGAVNHSVAAPSSTSPLGVNGGNDIEDTSNAVHGSCNTDRLAVYKVVLHTYWTRELFPKHYPDWRPPAQWTKTFGEHM